MKRQITSEKNDKPELKSQLALKAFIRAVDKVHAEDARIAAEAKAHAEGATEQGNTSESDSAQH